MKNLGHSPRESGSLCVVRRLSCVLASLALSLAVGCGDAAPWKVQDSGTDAFLYDVCVVRVPRTGDMCGWCVGSEGTILATSNSGETWVQQNSGTSSDLYCVDFVDALHGWAAGADGTVLATTDGGGTWTEQRSWWWAGSDDWVPDQTSTCLYSVDFVDAKRGWAVGMFLEGSAFAIASTKDGGQTWRARDFMMQGHLDSVAFTSRSRGYAVGDNWDSTATVFATTTDGGRSWDWDSVDGGPGLESVVFSDARHGWAVGEGATILATTNSGRSWGEQEWEMSGFIMTLRSVHFIDDRHGWVVGDDGLIVVTGNGGRTWSLQPADSEASLRAVAFGDAMHGWAVGESGTILATSTGGARQ